MKSLLTIFCALCLLNANGQTDSLLQRMIDSIKTQQQTRKPQAEDKEAPRILPEVSLVKKDTVKAVKRDTIRTAAVLPDSLVENTTNIPITKDTFQENPATFASVDTIKKSVNWRDDTAFERLLKIPVSSISSTSAFYDGDARMPEQKDYLFYVLTAVVLLLAVIKQLFPKYFSNMFHLMFQASFRQKQTREILMQAKLPSLLMNILFIVVGGLFLGIVADMYKNTLKWNNLTFWNLVVYSITFLALMYICKYVVIQFIGWAFNVREQSSTYSFIIFLINKILGLALLPLLLLLAFSSGYTKEIIVMTAGCIIAFMLILRYIVSLTIIRGAITIHPIHFFIYLCGIELMPMLVIYKVLLSYVGRSN